VDSAPSESHLRVGRESVTRLVLAMLCLSPSCSWAMPIGCVVQERLGRRAPVLVVVAFHHRGVHASVSSAEGLRCIDSPV